MKLVRVLDKTIKIRQFILIVLLLIAIPSICVAIDDRYNDTLLAISKDIINQVLESDYADATHLYAMLKVAGEHDLAEAVWSNRPNIMALVTSEIDKRVIEYSLTESERKLLYYIIMNKCSGFLVGHVTSTEKMYKWLTSRQKSYFKDEAIREAARYLGNGSKRSEN